MKRFHFTRNIIPLFALILLGAILAACQSAGLPTPTPTATEVLPTPTATPEPPRSLTICLGQEPQSLYIYGSTTRSSWSVLEAVYDGPVDTHNFEAQPVILEKIPSLSDGDAIYQPAAVKAGDEVLDANGDLVTLAKGAKVFPSGCRDMSCAIEWDGQSELQMDSLQITFKLINGVQWSDGTAVTAQDSLFSYQLASDAATPVSKTLADRTAAYEAVDDLTVRWTGKPGYVTHRFADHFWQPLPQHAWGGHSAAELLTSDDANRKPLGWGAYVIDEWTAGDHITLKKNPAYFRAGEGLPKFDTLTYRFLSADGNTDLAAMLTGECDLIDQSTLLEDQLSAVLELQNSGKLKAYIGQGPEWEHLDFGIVPASYDDGYQPESDRADFFSDVRVRQAVAACINREALNTDLMAGQSAAPNSFLAPTHPWLATDLSVQGYDPQRAASLLAEAGWVDQDGDPETPLQANGTGTAPAGTPFSVTYLTTQAGLRQQMAEKISGMLKQCGIEVKINTLSPEQLYTAGPDGDLFGRKFDLAEFAWQAGKGTPCYLYTTPQIPNAQNLWVGANITGYSSVEYDAACRAAELANPEQPEGLQAHHAVQEKFVTDLPVIPLLYRLKISVSRPDFCGFSLDVSARNEFWGVESYDYGVTCTP
ncbi:ABC-type dipeptide transport system, periplasmic component [Longilinea arvoryzae]|uniref:ABC-type dipeptide transport system, periplasmic component n=1 Tax=Longilinea arvoryzae TaxID=360412 RepID=A0A0S7B596_9CHLR|nr:peptide ABC transporter substrate-binding protein [Longilinea arvoryzae]GAP12287.1 ABC-type dipeptide transport system, periplasmic component [Longilinea arvoryzae]